MSLQDLKVAIRLDPGFKAKARNEKRFGAIRQHPDFVKLTGE
jgi:hypothetical protein